MNETVLLSIAPHRSRARRCRRCRSVRPQAGPGDGVPAASPRTVRAVWALSSVLRCARRPVSCGRGCILGVISLSLGSGRGCNVWLYHVRCTSPEGNLYQLRPFLYKHGNTREPLRRSPRAAHPRHRPTLPSHEIRDPPREGSNENPRSRVVSPPHLRPSFPVRPMKASSKATARAASRRSPSATPILLFAIPSPAAPPQLTRPGSAPRSS